MSLRNVRLAPTFNMKTCSFCFNEFPVWQYQTYSFLFFINSCACSVASFPGSHSVIPLIFPICSIHNYLASFPGLEHGLGMRLQSPNSLEWPHPLMFSLRVVTPPSLLRICELMSFLMLRRSTGCVSNGQTHSFLEPTQRGLHSQKGDSRRPL